MNEPMMFIVAMGNDSDEVFCSDLVAETYIDDLFSTGYQWDRNDTLEYGH